MGQQASTVEGSPDPPEKVADYKPPSGNPMIVPEAVADDKPSTGTTQPTIVPQVVVDDKPPVGNPTIPPSAKPADPASSPLDGGLKLTRPPPAQLDIDVSSGEEPETLPVVELGADGLPSVGSAAHASGDCRRCCFFPKGRCSNGHDCTFCHFGHDKRARIKKKKKSTPGSTPVSAQGHVAGTMAASLETPYEGHVTPMWLGTVSSTTPMGIAMPSTPVPLVPPSLGGIQSSETPPPPSDAPHLPKVEIKQLEAAMISQAAAEAASEEAVPTSSAAASRPPPLASPTGAAPVMVTGTPTGMTGKSITLTDLIHSATGGPLSPTSAPAPLGGAPVVAGSPCGAPCGMPGGWPLGYGGAAQGMWPPPYYSGMPAGYHYYPPSVTDASTRVPDVHSDALGLPPLVPSVQPNALDTDSLRTDSPRSVILTLSGAWGALTTGSPEKKSAFVSESSEYSRAHLLAYRTSVSGSRKPQSIKSLKVSGRAYY